MPLLMLNFIVYTLLHDTEARSKSIVIIQCRVEFKIRKIENKISLT